MKKPTIYIVMKVFRDYEFTSYDFVTWFFDENEAYKFAKETSDDYEVEECPGDMTKGFI